MLSRVGLIGQTSEYVVICVIIMKPRISIIIPIYNVEPYLRQCLDSIGLLGHDDVEIILVNDGSTDGSGKICTEYTELWNNVILINKTNGGLSDARNCGTDVAKGEYIYYLDSDDWLVPGAIETLYRFAIDNNCEVVQGGFYYAFEDHLEYDDRWIKDDDKPFILGREEAMRELMKNHYVKNFAWGRLYKANIVKKHLFPLGKFFEDSYWQHLVVHETVRYGVVPTPLYFYRQRKDSISGQSGKKLLDLYRGLEVQLVFLIENYPELVSIIADKLWVQSFSSRNQDADFKDFYDQFNAKYESFLSDSFKKSLFYILAKRESGLLPLYIFYQKVNGHLFSKPFKRVALE